VLTGGLPSAVAVQRLQSCSAYPGVDVWWQVNQIPPGASLTALARSDATQFYGVHAREAVSTDCKGASSTQVGM